VKKLLLLASTFGLVIIGSLWISFGSFEKGEGAETSSEISGYAWSSNIGVISFRGDMYGVDINPSSGDLSGYAWSSNIGFISFNSSDLVGCPTNPCSAHYEEGTFSGWAKALVADGDTWDGWISLSGGSYGLTAVGTEISGFAWGGEVIGLIKSLNMSMTAMLCQAGLDDDSDGILNEYDVDCGAILTECNDAIDNDADTFVDFGVDPGCDDPTDDLELDNAVSIKPIVELKVGIGSPAFESLNLGKAGGSVKLGIDVSNASTTTSCTGKIIEGSTDRPLTVSTGGVEHYTTQQSITITKGTRITLTCETGGKAGSDSVTIVIKDEHEF
jgi:hypothetical protein